MSIKRWLHVAAAGLIVAALGGLGVASAATQTATPSSYTAVTPFRLLDTRQGAEPAANKPVVLAVAGADSVPAGVTAVTVTLTVTAPTAGGYLVAWPDGQARPVPASDLNFSAGQAIATQTTVAVTDGKIDIENVSGGPAQIVVDLHGYYTAPFAPQATVVKDLGGAASVATGGSFVTNSAAVGTVALAAGTWDVTLSMKATPSAAFATANPAVQVTPELFLYNQAPNADFAGDLLNIGSGSLETGGNANIDEYYSGTAVITLAVPTTLDVDAFGYDSDRGAGSYVLDDATVSAVSVASAAQ
jgi:hypothetical protein